MAIAIKLKKRNIILWTSVLVLLIISIYLLNTITAYIKQKNYEDQKYTALNSADVETFIESYGWQIEKSSGTVEKIVIPPKFNEAYKAYSSLMESDNFKLTHYMGKEAERFKYEIKNYPGIEKDIYAVIIVCDKKIIAGNVECDGNNGFIDSLSFPETERN